MKTTLNAIREHSPCADGWKKLMTNLGKTEADDEPLSLLEVLDFSGLDFTISCFRAVEGHEKEKRLYAVWCARQVQHLMKDPRSIEALDVAERYANGQATNSERSAARTAAEAAVREAEWTPVGECCSEFISERRSGPVRLSTRAAEWAALSAVGPVGGWVGGKARIAARDAAEEAAMDDQEKQLRLILSQS